MITRRRLLASVAGIAVLSATGAHAASHKDTPIKVLPDQLKFTRSGAVEIVNKELAEALQNDRRATMSFLQKNMPGLRAGDIKVDKSGRILVSNENISDLLKDRTSSDLANLNIVCGKGC